jgi:hypothetical protein
MCQQIRLHATCECLRKAVARQRDTHRVSLLVTSCAFSKERGETALPKGKHGFETADLWATVDLHSHLTCNGIDVDHRVVVK